MNSVSEAAQDQPPVVPQIRNVTAGDVVEALNEGIIDFLKAPLYGLFFGGIYAVGGLFILASLTVFEMKWMIVPIVIGFPLIGPFIAIGLYEISRRRAAGQELAWREILTVMMHNREHQFGMMAFLILCVFWIWVFSARLLLAIFLGFLSFPTVTAFLEQVFGTTQGLAFLAIGSVFGAILSFVRYSATVISIPMLLDRNVDCITAIITSFKAVTGNPVVMLGWGLTVAILAILGTLPFFAGIVIILPVLGHATWHLYEKVIS